MDIRNVSDVLCTKLHLSFCLYIIHVTKMKHYYFFKLVISEIT